MTKRKNIKSENGFMTYHHTNIMLLFIKILNMLFKIVLIDLVQLNVFLRIKKSNGLYLEAFNNASEKTYITMYTMACTVVLFLTIIEANYSKNAKCYKNEKIVTHKVYKDKRKVRVMSLFKIGLTLFHRAINSTKYIRLPIKFILYDI